MLEEKYTDIYTYLFGGTITPSGHTDDGKDNWRFLFPVYCSHSGAPCAAGDNPYFLLFTAVSDMYQTFGTKSYS